MPTYEYACADCGEHLEVVQSFKDDPLTDCPHCQGRLNKVFSAAGIIFKGSGWHVKDYATKGAPSKAGSGDTTSSESTTSSTSDKPGASDKPSKSSDKPSKPSSDSSSDSSAA